MKTDRAHCSLKSGEMKGAEPSREPSKAKVKALLESKLKRIQAGGEIRTLDLFAGCGGIALGFHAAGFQTVGAVEIDPFAALSFARNFGKYANHADPATLGLPRDITKLDPPEFLKGLGLNGPVDDSVDVLVGGPPCQAFARVGRAKLREVDSHPQAFKQDPRGNLYLRYLAYIRATRPLAILMENVPDVLNYGGHNISQEVCEVLEAEGYSCKYTLLNSAYYGIPQMRERMFLVAIHGVAKRSFEFPEPTHFVNLPSGYEQTRVVALKAMRDAGSGALLGEDIFTSDENHLVRPPVPKAGLQGAITVEQAIYDLPFLDAAKLLKDGVLVRGAKRFDKALPYRSEPHTGFARLMREWPGFEARDGVYDHVIRYLPRDFKLFKRMKPGDQYPQAHAMAVTMFKEEYRKLQRKGHAPAEGTKAWQVLWDSFVPPYDASKFPNKWRKLEADMPSRTLLAHLGKDSYSHIHPDNGQGRTISVRDGARLQSFPDGFLFEGTINPAFKQIGNAVPPLMAYALARNIRTALGAKELKDIRIGYIL
jgi:DNA (cytosine-5)-methyltransferase 1